MHAEWARRVEPSLVGLGDGEAECLNDDRVERLPIYPEERHCRAPSTDRVLEVFDSLQGHRLRREGRATEIFEPELDKMQLLILRLLGLPASLFRIAS